MRKFGFVVVAVVLVLAVGSAPAGMPRPGFVLASRLPALSHTSGGTLDEIDWVEHVYTTSTNEQVAVGVSPSYPADQPIGQHWADFFAALPHGPELAHLKAYIAPPAEVAAICGTGAVGCYGNDQLIITNEPALGFDPEEVARHEYGHHIALNRTNTPWPAFDWGPKHWATAARICPRVHWNTAYPGDESLLYKLNPGEAFAETYRVLVDTQHGETNPTWPLVDPSFYPDQTTLDAAAHDLTTPWTTPTQHRLRVRGQTWEHRLATPLDGTLTVHLTWPARIVVTDTTGQPIRPTQHHGRTLSYQICGQRTITIHLNTHNQTHNNTLQLTTP